ncbi:UNVERIFIED_CONTAM: hypothetical protein PYX00_002270 [Menopon gallinae]|uniref:Periodic tryptophan protein 1 homolog n=1 Tax=Menopon gallinae TaxID=328185 RepID=A0AAW2II94_9NEOP
MEEGDEPSSINFVPCIRWIRKGVAKQDPVKIELSKQELTELVKSTSNKLKLGEQDEGSDEEENQKGNQVPMSIDDEYDMDNYDNDGDSELNVGDIAVYSNDDPYNVNDEPDSDAEDDIIKPNDNLIVVGHVEGYASSLEIYVHNDFEDSLYVHHDILLPSIPLCIEWLNYDPANVNRSANLCAVGSMAPIIDVWDIDLVNCIEPAYKLGKKGSRKKGTPQVGHKDAVLDLSWNTELTHILASGSADKTVILWDLENKAPHTTLSAFEEKVQTLVFHPSEAHSLLVGSCDRSNKVFDCRSSETYKVWNTEGEVERVVWNRFSPSQFISSDSKGFIYCFDCRQEEPVWKVAAHTREVTGLVLSSQCPGFLATASQDGMYKVWDISGTPEVVSERNLKIGEIQCLETAPDEPFLVASGGDRKNRNMLVFNAIDDSAVQQRFRSRELVPEPTIEGTSAGTSESSKVHAVTKKDRVNSLKVVKKKKEFKKPN